MKKRNLFVAGAAFGLALALQSGCANNSIVTSKPGTAPQSASKPHFSNETSSLGGRVVETFDASGYTYVNMEKDGKRIWAAMPVTKVKVGEEIEIQPGTLMGKFTSKTLNRTFEEIIFTAGLKTDAKTQLPAGYQPVDAKPQISQQQPVMTASPLQKDHMGMMAQPKEAMTAISGTVVETMDSGRYTYINLESDGKKAWAAIPATQIKVGQQLTLQPGTKMDNFTSKSLNRTFDSIIFSGGIVPAAK